MEATGTLIGGGLGALAHMELALFRLVRSASRVFAGASVPRILALTLRFDDLLVAVVLAVGLVVGAMNVVSHCRIAS